jgi:hypothetical protein
MNRPDPNTPHPVPGFDAIYVKPKKESPRSISIFFRAHVAKKKESCMIAHGKTLFQTMGAIA